MQTIVKDGKSSYLFDDIQTVVLLKNKTVVYNIDGSLDLTIADCSSNNSQAYTDVTPPEDWVGNKYLFDGVTWSVNPDWIDPAIEQE